MKRLDVGAGIGLLLVAVGALLLLQTLDILVFDWALVWALLFAAGGVVFLVAFARSRDQWWALIPGFTMLSLGAMIAVGTILPGAGGGWMGSVFLGGISLGFWAVYLSQRSQWWAVIPAGTLLTLALVAGLSEVLPGLAVGGVFFLGLAATFAVVAAVPTAQGRQSWAVYPAAVLGVIGLIITAAGTQLLPYVLAAALIVGGLLLMLRGVRGH